MKDSNDVNYRPQNFEDFIGQDDIINSLKIYVSAAKIRKESLDHVLLYGPPGLGKTTLANIIANELGVGIKKISAPTIEKQSDIICVMATLNPGDILFIDEIHRLPKFIEEMLYSAMEDYHINFIFSKDGESKNIDLNLPPFTLVGATTNYGQLSSPFRNRFGIKMKLKYYDEKSLSNIIKRTSKVYSFPVDDKSSNEIAKRSRFTPRIANNIFKRVRDIAIFNNKKEIKYDEIFNSFSILKIDEFGLEEVDIEYLELIHNKFNDGPVGIEALSSSMNEASINIEEYIEPYLLQLNFIQRSPKGRILTEKGINHLKQLL